MPWFRFARFALVGMAIALPLAALTGAVPATKTTTHATTTRKTTSTPHATKGKPSNVDRGKYLVTVAGCGDCHTPGTLFGAPDFDRQLSGSEVGWAGPWGVSYARNLTPDKETGLGNWSDADIITAIRAGRRPDGRVLLPPMPWQDFTAFTDDDAHAIVAYLRSIPAVSHKVPDPLSPTQSASTPVITIPIPGAWDAPKGGSPPAEHK